MERWIRKTVEFGAGLVFTGKVNPSVIPYFPQKTEISGEEERYFRRAVPESVGISSGRLTAMLKALEQEKRANIHNLLVIRHGEVICECSHPGYSVNTWHLSHSMSKTVTGMAIGLLVDEGLLGLDERVVDIFKDAHYTDARYEQMTVRHLLTMSSGARFSEAGVVSETAWTSAFFSSGLQYSPGEGFNYNSMNSYLLARIAVMRSGRTLTELVNDRIFAPLHITNFFWEMGPEGVEKGGWGLFLSAESWGKLGLMMLGGGVFEGRRILSEDWVRQATQVSAHAPKGIGHYDYGYQLWRSREGEDYLFNGMFGQNVWICPKNDLVVVINAGNNELFQNSPALAVVEKYMSADLNSDLTDSCFAGDYGDLCRTEAHFFERRHQIRPYAPHLSLGHRLRLRHRSHYPPDWEMLLGKYHFAKNNFGMLPLLIRGMQNNMRSSLDGISFERDGGEMLFCFTECGVQYSLRVGFTDFATSVLEVRGEKYIVKVMGEAMEDEDRNPLFKLELLFPEMPNHRLMKITLIEGGLLVRMSELPNNSIANVFISDMSDAGGKLAFFYELVERRMGKNFAVRKLEETFAPAMIGARIGGESYTAIMDKDRERLKAGEKSARVINALVTRFLHDEDDEHADADFDRICTPHEIQSRGRYSSDAQRGGFKTFIDDVVERIRTKLGKQSSVSVQSTQSAQSLPPAQSAQSLPPAQSLPSAQSGQDAEQGVSLIAEHGTEQGAEGSAE